jgi:hypothetical protein
MTTIIPERLAKLPEIHLRAGTGHGGNGTFDGCAVQLADWLAGGTGASGRPKCVSRKIGAYVIGLNDSILFKDHRDLLKPYCAKIVGTAGEDDEREVRRAYVLADYAVRVFAPIWLRADPKHRFDEHAAKLEALSPITSEETRKAAHREAWVAESAAYAASAADAAYAADAAVAASAASAAVAESAAYAAYAAYAADAAVAASAASAESAAVAESAAYAAYAASAAYAADAADAASAASAASAAYAARPKVLADHDDLLRAKALECLEAVLAC